MIEQEDFRTECDCCNKIGDIGIAVEIIMGVIFIVCPECDSLLYDLTAGRKTEQADLWNSLL